MNRPVLVPVNSDSVPVGAAFFIFDSDDGRPVVAAARTLNDIHFSAAVLFFDADAVAVAVSASAFKIIITVIVRSSADGYDLHVLTANSELDDIINGSAPHERSASLRARFAGAADQNGRGKNGEYKKYFFHFLLSLVFSESYFYKFQTVKYLHKQLKNRT
jgi:hypothetical protein